MGPIIRHLLISIFGYILLCHTTFADELTYDAVEYHCGDFLNNTFNDPFMQFVYYFNNEFIRLISHPFQHEKLFPGDKIDVDIIKKSFMDKTNVVSL
jgi:hypothetical protein